MLRFNILFSWKKPLPGDRLILIDSIAAKIQAFGGVTLLVSCNASLLGVFATSSGHRCSSSSYSMMASSSPSLIPGHPGPARGLVQLEGS